MKGESDVVAHVVAATGVAEAEVRRVIEAAFGFVKSSALAGEQVDHPSLGTIRPRQRDKGGVTKTVFRFLPEGAGGGGAKGAGGGKAGGGATGAGARKAGRGEKRGGAGAGRGRKGAGGKRGA
jgi:hypothetical protein